MVLGLDNAGKTSILLSLKDETNLMSYLNLKSTKGVEIVDLDDSNEKYYLWDFGGQASYRERYLTDLKKYLLDSEKIVYVLDVQDQKRYDLAIEYLENILKVAIEAKVTIDLTIFFHKCDHKLLAENPAFSEEALNKLAEKVIKKIPKTFHYSIFKTSIYTVFEKIFFKEKGK